MNFADPIAHHALRQPHATAVALPYNDVTYAAFDADINAVANHLASVAGRGSRVALVVGDPYVHWTLLFALGRLGAVSVSLESGKYDLALPTVRPDLVLSERPLAGAYAAQEIRTDLQWLNNVVAGGNTTRLPAIDELDIPTRIALSSGTTGKPKMVQLTRRQLQQRLKSGTFNEPGRFYERLLCIIGLAALAGFTSPLRTWWAGGSVCLFLPMAQLIAHRKVSGIIASPRQIVSLLDSIPPLFQRMDDLWLMIGGSRVPPIVRSALVERLAGHASMSYGSTEAGSVANMPFSLLEERPDATGIILPWVSVQAVDPNGKVLPSGEIGEIRIKSADMAMEYLDNPEATERHFRDGWFHPGDSGSVSADGVLSVLGRVDDVANIGGVKIAPDVIEDILRDVPGIDDVGVFMSDADGVQRVYAAIVVQGMPDLDDAQRRVIQRMPGGDVPLTFMTVPSIPRNHMGKIERAQLKAHAVTAAARAVGLGVH